MIGQYTLYRWVLYFYIYCFLGWVFESCYVSLMNRKWVNRGFLHGPFLPIYGSGAVMMLFVSAPFKDNLILTYFAGLAGATLLELVTGMLMEALFKVRYWDYSKQKFNFKGYICLSSSIAWGFFTIIMNELIHPCIEKVLTYVPKIWEDSMMTIVTVLLVSDICLSVRDALNLRNILVGMENVRREVIILRKRADVVIAVLDQEWKEYLKTHPVAERIEEVGKELEERFTHVKNMFADANRLSKEQREEFLEMKEKFSRLKSSSLRIKNRGTGNVHKMIKGNPSMTSSKYGHSLSSLKMYLKDQK